MSFHSFSYIVRTLPYALVPLATILTTYLYLYPVFLGCAFPSIDRQATTAFYDTLIQHYDSTNPNPIDTRPALAPFRLLVLADPQLEGDSSLPKPEDAFLSKVIQHRDRFSGLDSNVEQWLNVTTEVIKELVFENIPDALQAVRKRLDLFGNDYYLAHIFRTLHWWTKPTHVTALGDLIGSQWVDDEEFEWRGWRYWNRVFRGTTKVDGELMIHEKESQARVLSMDDANWKTLVVNIAGNHDIGYAGDISKSRMDRFEDKYGKANWDVRFEYPQSRMLSNKTVPTLHLVVLNSMLLDTPAMDKDLQDQTYGYLNDLIRFRVKPVEDHTDFTLLLTHVPLHKEEGICVDPPFFDFWDDDNCGGECEPHAVKEQNHLSEHSSHSGILQSLFGMSADLDAAAQGKGRPGLILNGHDHEGCNVWHYIPINTTYIGSQTKGDDRKTLWEATRWDTARKPMAHTGVQEVTLRSMMGEYGGSAGLLSAWFDFENDEWRYDIQMCKLGVQHIWWAIHVIDLLAVGSILSSVSLEMRQRMSRNIMKRPPRSKTTKVE